MTEMNCMIAEMSSVYHLENWVDDKVYHNAKALLKIYSKVVWRLHGEVAEMEKVSYEYGNSTLLDYLNCFMDIDTRVNRERFKNRLQSLQESNCIIKLINNALVKLKNYPQDGKRYFQILNKCYLVHSKYDETDLLESFNISRETFYRDKKRAVRYWESYFGVL